MKSFPLCTIAILGVLAVGCGVDAGDGENVDATGASSSNATARKDDPAPAKDDDDMLEATPAADQSAYGPVEVDKTVDCTGRNGDSVSVSRLSYGTESGRIKSLTVTMNNALHVGKNAIAISVRGPSDTTYTPTFTSDANLLDGSTAAVPLPTDFKVQLGASIQIETMFEGGWMGDTTGVCRIQL